MELKDLMPYVLKIVCVIIALAIYDLYAEPVLERWTGRS